jgi:hypothetical protein
MYPFIRSCPFFLVERKEYSMSQPALFPTHIGRPVAAVADPTHAEVHIQLTTIALPGGRALFLAAVDGALVLNTGFAGESALHTVARGVSIPAETWPVVRRALDELAAAP